MQSNLEDVAKLLLRLLVGVLLLLHGVHKIFTGVGGIGNMLAAHQMPAGLAYAVYLGEVVGPILIILGIWVRIGGLLAFINMVVAVLLTHGGAVFYLNSHGGWVIELEAFYGICGLVVAMLGAGIYSLGSTHSRLN